MQNVWFIIFYCLLTITKKRPKKQNTKENKRKPQQQNYKHKMDR